MHFLDVFRAQIMIGRNGNYANGTNVLNHRTGIDLQRNHFAEQMAKGLGVMGSEVFQKSNQTISTLTIAAEIRKPRLANPLLNLWWLC